jgi:hypothetical protein
LPTQFEVTTILDTIKNQESGSYTSNPYGPGGASGAYQFIDSTWQGLTKEFGIGQQFPRAYQAPAQVQDQVAADYVGQILQQNNEQVPIIPLVWYTGNPQGQISASALAANHGLLPSTYQANWLAEYNKLLKSGTGSGDISLGPITVPSPGAIVGGIGAAVGQVPNAVSQLAPGNLITDAIQGLISSGLVMRGTLIVTGLIILFIGISQLGKGSQSAGQTVSGGVSTVKVRVQKVNERAKQGASAAVAA